MQWEYKVSVIDCIDWPDEGTLDGELVEANLEEGFRFKKEAETGLNIYGYLGYEVATATLTNNGKLFVIMKKPIPGEPEIIDEELKDDFEKELLRPKNK